MRRAIYPGSFDPITNGHLEILEKALEVFDEIIILVADNPKKKSRFTSKQRVEMIKSAVKKYKNVSVDSTTGLTVDYAKKAKTLNLIRGLRNATDYKYEMKLLNLYRKENPNINMVFFMSSDKNVEISSSKIHKLFLSKKDISKYVPKAVLIEYKKRWANSSFYFNK